MPAWDYHRVLWRYTTNQGTNALYRAQKGYTDQVATLGGAAASAPYPEPLRYGLKHRIAIVTATVDSTVYKRRVPVFDKTAFNALVPGTTTVNINCAGNSVSGTVQSLEGERYHGAGLTG